MNLPASPAGPKALATLTDRQIFDYLCLNQPATRTQISTALGLSKPTASQGISRLQENRLVSPVEVLPGADAAVRRGRAPESYGINQGYGHLLGLSLEAGTLLGRTTDLAGCIVVQGHRVVPAEASAAQVQQLAGSMVEELTAASSGRTLGAALSQSSPVLRVGVDATALPTPVYPGSSASLVPVVQELTGAPAVLDNDVNWMAVAQARHDQPAAASSMMLLYVGPGIGTALVIDGTVHRGASGTAGELNGLRLAHQTFLQRLAAAGLTEEGSSKVDCTRLAKLLAAGGPVDPLVDSFTLVLAEVLGNLLAFFDPQRLVLCGPLAHFEAFTNSLNQALASRMGSSSSVVEVSELGEDAALRGALFGARAQYLSRLWSNYRIEEA
ncbi:ROK family transcriptional regulator [Glutamicibacter sp.]|uniref:ROK family transcriptional regulator n=1 Tax=Glutamicibacter sp. TaxID=1931995 RepID=UPI002B490E4A|nr:ROK family transcriptional regulator [Glutamicibacter sp.]HJX78032.1 ROK family transcriptional regulator [Glutamicibacter sp.]